MFGWSLWLVTSTSHFRWSHLGFPGVWDSVGRGLPAALPVSSSAAQCDVALSFPLPCRSCQEP